MASTREKLEALEELQKLDLAIQEARTTLQKVPARLKEFADAKARATAALQAERKRVDENDRGRRMLERSVQDERDKIKKWEGRLGELKTSAQYAALAREVDISKKQNKTLEEEILRFMEEAEALKQSLAIREAELRKVDADTAAETGGLEAQQRAAKEKLDLIEGRRGDLARKVDPGLLSRYETIKKRRLGVAVVPVASGRCTGCNMSLPPQLSTTLQSHNSIETCPHCNRIIFVPKAPEAEARQA